MPEALNAVHEELCRFAKLKPHPNLIVCKGFHRYGVLYEYCSGGNVEELLWEYPQRSDWQMARIAIQIADCLVHLHQQHFIHCDLTLQNNFLTAVGFVKVGDIQGQFNFPDGTPEIHALSSEHCTYRHPAASENEQSERADLFAFGMCLHYLWHGRAAFREFDELSTLGRFDEIRARYRNHDFPPLKCSAGIAQIMEKC
jgi:serine/threonine protein kinase